MSPSGAGSGPAEPTTAGAGPAEPATAGGGAASPNGAGGGPLTIGVVKEVAAGERRVAMVPAVLPRLIALGVTVLVETGAGAGAFAADSAYAQAGASVADASVLDERADVLLCLGWPDPDRLARLRPGTLVVGLLAPASNPEPVAVCQRHGIQVASMDLVPRTLSRAQPMDALSSQAGIAGYRAVLLAANTYGGYFPMLMTAAGTAKPAQVLVLGAGVAGLAAIGTARRLGALVSGYDIRPQTRDEVRSMGAQFLELGETPAGDGTGGYARELTAAEREAQQTALQTRMSEFDVVITTAQVPGRKPPVLVTAEALKGMRPGSVVVDLACGPLGGNVEGSAPEQSVVVGDGVTVLGAGTLPAAMAPGASAAYARNITALMAHLIRDGALVLDPADEITGAILVAPAEAAA